MLIGSAIVFEAVTILKVGNSLLLGGFAIILMNVIIFQCFPARNDVARMQRGLLSQWSASANSLWSVPRRVPIPRLSKRSPNYGQPTAPTALTSSSPHRQPPQSRSDSGDEQEFFTSTCSTESFASSPGSDIQRHLQSMFYLLRPEKAPKVTVKLKSLRTGRTRYLMEDSFASVTLATKVKWR